jgi:hypothetical protein
MSWTLLKTLPYLILIALGVVLYILIRGLLKRNRKAFRILAVLVIPLPFFLYFIVNPIYEGDFSNNFRSEKGVFSELKSGRLTVLTIPGCPYCYESIEDLKRIKERTGVDTIDFFVVTTHSENLDWYREEAKGQLNIQMLSPESELVALAMGTFPTFLFAEADNVSVWDNSGFGVRAKDWIEDKIAK